MDAQNAYGFAAFHVPEPHGFVIRSWNKITTVVGEDHIAGLRLVPPVSICRIDFSMAWSRVSGNRRMNRGGRA